MRREPPSAPRPSPLPPPFRPDAALPRAESAAPRMPKGCRHTERAKDAAISSAVGGGRPAAAAALPPLLLLLLLLLLPLLPLLLPLCTLM